MIAEVQKDVELIWNYLRRAEHDLKPADAILLLGSHDIRVADTASVLYQQGYAPIIIVSGGLAPGTKDIFGVTEARAFSDRLEANGVPRSIILQEDKSTNTSENIQFSYKLIETKVPNLTSLILVQKPYMTRRAYATFMRQWPGKLPHIQTASSPDTFTEYDNGSIPTDKIIDTMVGDLQRIKEYPKLGYQIEQEIPGAVWSAWERLVEAGYNKHLIG